MTIVEAVRNARETRMSFARKMWAGRKTCGLAFWTNGEDDGVGDKVWCRASLPRTDTGEHKIWDFHPSVDDLAASDWEMSSP